MTQPTNRTAKPAHELIAVALLWLLVIAFFWKIALAGRVLAGGDVLTYFYPYWAEATRAIRGWRLPLWNPYLFMGTPFLANSQAGVFYPFNWPLWLLLQPHRAIHLSIVLHLCLAALNGYLWGRASLRLGSVGAWTVGATFALGGYLGSQVEHVNQLQGLAWLPLALTLYDQSSQGLLRHRIRRGLSALGGLGAVAGLVLLAGHTQTAFISLVGLAAYGLGPALWDGLRGREWTALAWRALAFGAAVGLGIALAAIQLMPTWELSRLSVRAGGLPFKERVSFSLSPFYLARAFLPSLGGAVPAEHIEHVAYVGMTGLALAGVGLGTSMRREDNSRSTKSGVCFLTALGFFFALGVYNPVYALLARGMPGFVHFRVPARWLALYAAGVAGLAGQGARALFHGRVRIGARRLVVFVVPVIALVGWAVVGARIEEGRTVVWLTLAAWLVGIAWMMGLLLTGSRAPRLAVVGLLGLLVVELFAAGSMLPYRRATAPQAFTSLRPAITHLLGGVPGSGFQSLSAAAESAVNRAGKVRFLSMSDITFDPGDLPQIEAIYGPQLSPGALYDYVVAAKHKEVLSPNLPLAFCVPAVDGYDGGVLPLARYVMLQRLFLGEDEVSMDGRLRENLAAIPNGRWLSLFNVRHVITDKLQDAWLGGVFYDLQFGALLSGEEAVAVAEVPRFEATSVGLVSYLQGGAALPQGTKVGVVELGFSGGLTRTFALRAGEHTAEGLYGPHVDHSQATVGGHFRSGVRGQGEQRRQQGNNYVTRLAWHEPAAPTAVSVRATLPDGELVVRGVSLIDERTGAFQVLVLSDRGRFRLAHSGDVKVYENLDVLPRAFLVHKATSAAGDEAALALMQDPAFDPAAEVVLSEEEAVVQPASSASLRTGDAGLGTVARRGERASVGRYERERVEIEVVAESPGFLVLTDAWYPGWEATVDDELAPVRRADLLFRAVSVDAGRHHVVFTLRSTSLSVGMAISAVGLVGLIVVGVLAQQGPKVIIHLEQSLGRLRRLVGVVRTG